MLSWTIISGCRFPPSVHRKHRRSILLGGIRLSIWGGIGRLASTFRSIIRQFWRDFRYIPDARDRSLAARKEERAAALDVVLSFAGWRAAGSRAHRAIAALTPGDPLTHLHEDGQWKVLDHGGRQVGYMARKWALPSGMSIESVVVQGIFTCSAKDEQDKETQKMVARRELGGRRAEAHAILRLIDVPNDNPETLNRYAGSRSFESKDFSLDSTYR